MKLAIGFLTVVALFNAGPALALSCLNEIKDDPIIVAGTVVGKSRPEVRIDKSVVASHHVAAIESYQRKTWVADIEIGKVLKGEIGEPGDIIQVSFPPPWPRLPDGREVNVRNGPILVGASRIKDGSLSWFDCMTLGFGNSVDNIDWDLDPAKASHPWIRDVLEIWHTSRSFLEIVHNTAPALATKEEVNLADELLTSIKDHERKIAFHRQRFFTTGTVADGARYAEVLMRARALEKAEWVVVDVENRLGPSKYSNAVKNTIKLAKGELASPPFVDISSYLFQKGLRIDVERVGLPEITSVTAWELFVNGASFEGAEITDFEVLRGSLRKTNFSGTTLRNFSLDGHPGPRLGNKEFGIDADGASFANAVIRGFRVRGNFNHADFRNVHGASVSFQGSLRSARFDGAYIDGVSFSDVNLSGASLRNVHFKDASFRGVNLNGADLSGATFEGTTDWYRIEHDETTLWPNGERPFEHDDGEYPPLPRCSEISKPSYSSGLVLPSGADCRAD